MFQYRLVYLRKSFNLTQTDLGKILSMTQRSISRFETGETFPDEKTLNLIADYFNVSTDYLLGRTDIKNIYSNNK
ncbi:transcriptional repressor DicA [uncultured Clostridium sp.]|nr:transcriptional repressor DicA [uncultured Clostridium sp.]SCJ45606.1 transcriptional repressor DicA [uncultured Clostridium sp.]